jgi:hypothetical protein
MSAIPRNFIAAIIFARNQIPEAGVTNGRCERAPGPVAEGPHESVSDSPNFVSGHPALRLWGGRGRAVPGGSVRRGGAVGDDFGVLARGVERGRNPGAQQRRDQASQSLGSLSVGRERAILPVRIRGRPGVNRPTTCSERNTPSRWSVSVSWWATQPVMPFPSAYAPQ